MPAPGPFPPPPVGARAARSPGPAARGNDRGSLPAGPRALLVDVHLWLQREHVKSVNATALSRWQQNTLRPYGVSPRLGSRPGVRRLRTARAQPPSRGPGGFGRKVPGSARGGNRRLRRRGRGREFRVCPSLCFTVAATPSGRASRLAGRIWSRVLQSTVTSSRRVLIIKKVQHKDYVEDMGRVNRTTELVLPFRLGPTLQQDSRLIEVPSLATTEISVEIAYHRICKFKYKYMVAFILSHYSSYIL